MQLIFTFPSLWKGCFGCISLNVGLGISWASFEVKLGFIRTRILQYMRRAMLREKMGMNNLLGFWDYDNWRKGSRWAECLCDPSNGNNSNYWAPPPILMPNFAKVAMHNRLATLHLEYVELSHISSNMYAKKPQNVESVRIFNWMVDVSTKAFLHERQKVLHLWCYRKVSIEVIGYYLESTPSHELPT